ncbi:uncharacterized protein si:zfos-911d5.4 [Megalobrama amblycephala]|uniref:uncharacterized protein si:zfos-911d5.4 n=1 Tax=Megalobrama amblycephala TaxID=75352 RepID=UPI002013F6ED|nr:uncharacterized protein si:zfos-911d5.4 [Megalobrama amblycephala]XP_048026690.1 uncharacterized protein si:zfos-911d5.4 [Megalobrama amblycephala]XP_048026691.1 uncharacterized protein si:zfos-911d5.4 [Megalobrama amblycephala]
MFQMVQFLVPSGPKRPGNISVSQPTGQKRTQTASYEFLQHVRTVSGLRQQDMFYNLRVPNQFQTDRDEINLLLLTGHGVFCIDLKTWSGSVSAQIETHVRAQQQTFSSVSVEQLPDALQAITVKTSNLCSHMKRCGLNVRPSLFIPRILLLSPDCVLSDELLQTERLVSGADVQTFLRSLREGYTSWLSDAFTPSWISGHLSYGQMRALRERLELMGTWDLLQMSGGQELSGDFQSCQHLAINRQETDLLEFNRAGSLITDTLWSLLGHTPQVTVSMYKRGAQGWLGKPLIATATIPSSTRVIFRIRGETTDAKIPAGSIRSITLSI